MGYIAEKYNYVKGLIDGLDLDEDNKETKVIKAMMELLSDMAIAIEDLEEANEETNEMLDEIDSDLSYLEDVVYEDELDDFEDDLSDSTSLGELECPECEALVSIDPTLIDEDTDSIVCPNCGYNIEIEWLDDCDCCNHDLDDPEQE